MISGTGPASRSSRTFRTEPLRHTRCSFRKFDGPGARSGVTLTSTIVDARADRAALDELAADACGGRVRRRRSESVSTGTHAPRQRQPPRDVRAGRSPRRSAPRGRSADSTRAVLPPRVTATIAAASRVCGQRDRRLADRRGRAPAAGACPRARTVLTGGIDSASRMTRSSVCTARTG